MADKDASTPRVYIARHGETEWTKNGRYTGTTELELTADGVKQVKGSGTVIIGTGKLIDPTKLAHVFISPRKRAQMTFDILFEENDKQSLQAAQKISTTKRLAEWDYGLYEGLSTREIRALRKEHGLDQETPWDIWRDGCEGGEYATSLLYKACVFPAQAPQDVSTGDVSARQPHPRDSCYTGAEYARRKAL
ncbi:MAG: hypothetical protein M1838_000050 [Thelocarpon superellum]|nr:MAG: hypothetical protein M1838_000050 [Thelocarpon superellum]